MLEKSLHFLKQLKENNYKEWFQENKSTYDDAKNEFLSFTGLLITEIMQMDKTIVHLEPKDCTFRIFRDVRFTNDKTPYKTNFGAFIARGGGRKSEFGGYYFHLEPGNCMAGGGVWMPQPDVLKAMRHEIYVNSDEYLGIIHSSTFTAQFDGLFEEGRLKTAPKDFPKDWPHIDLLKYKNYATGKSIPDEKLSDTQIIKEVRAIFSAMVPFNTFLNQAILDLRE